MYLNAIRENKILARISDFRVNVHIYMLARMKLHFTCMWLIQASRLLNCFMLNSTEHGIQLLKLIKKKDFLNSLICCIYPADELWLTKLAFEHS